MGINFAQDWPVYILLALVAWFFIFAIISGNRQEKIKKRAQNKETDKKSG